MIDHRTIPGKFDPFMSLTCPIILLYPWVAEIAILLDFRHTLTSRPATKTGGINSLINA